MATTEEILNQLLSLPVDTRARVAQRLLESLESADDTNRRLWDAEIESRLDAYERGELQAVPGDEVLARLVLTKYCCLLLFGQPLPAFYFCEINPAKM